MTIPQKIIQIWCQGTPPDDVKNAMESWKKFHPEFDYILFDDVQAVDFLKEHFDQKVLSAYKICTIPAMRSDLLRYALLYKFGGIYIDADEQCLRNLEEWLDFEQSFICLERENNKIIINGFIASEPNHPILIFTINTVVEKILHRTFINMWEITGAGTFAPIVRKFLEYKPEEQGIKVLPFLEVYRKHTKVPKLLYRKEEHWSKIQEIKPIFEPLIEVEESNFILLPFVFTGHSRSGTAFITRLLQKYGVNVLHEITYASHGIVSWWVASTIKKENDRIYSYSLAKSVVKKVYFESLIHIISDPHATIPSIVLENEFNNRDNNSFKHRRNQIKKHFNIDLETIDNPFECAAFSYVYWYKLIFQKRPTLQIKVEEAENKILKLITDHHIPFYKFQVQNINLSNVNSSAQKFQEEKPSFTEEDVKLWSTELRQQLNIICKRHRYSEF